MKNMKKININSIAQKCARKPDNFIIIHHLGVCKAKLHNVIDMLPTSINCHNTCTEPFNETS